MLPLHYATRWQVAGALLLLLVLGSALMPELTWLSEDDLRDILREDKWLHFLSFTFLAVWYCGQYAKRHYWRLALGLIVFGALIEVCQAFTAYRHADLVDFFADVGGVAVGLALGAAGLGGWSARVERWWLGRAHASD